MTVFGPMGLTMFDRNHVLYPFVGRLCGFIHIIMVKAGMRKAVEEASVTTPESGSESARDEPVTALGDETNAAPPLKVPAPFASEPRLPAVVPEASLRGSHRRRLADDAPAEARDGVGDGDGNGDGVCDGVTKTHPLTCGAHVAVLVPAPLTLEKGVLATTAPDASSSSSLKPKLAPRVKPSTATLATMAFAAKVTCRNGAGSHGQ